eukprot:g31851.t1
MILSPTQGCALASQACGRDRLGNVEVVLLFHRRGGDAHDGADDISDNSIWSECGAGAQWSTLIDGGTQSL